MACYSKQHLENSDIFTILDFLISERKLAGFARCNGMQLDVNMLNLAGVGQFFCDALFCNFTLMLWKPTL